MCAAQTIAERERIEKEEEARFEKEKERLKERKVRCILQLLRAGFVAA